MPKTYKYGEEVFEVSDPKDCKITVAGKGLTGEITIHEQTGMYREALMGWGTDQPSIESAMNGICRRILERAARDSKGELCKGMSEFYEDLG